MSRRYRHSAAGRRRCRNPGRNLSTEQHRANILNTHYGHIGIGVAVSGSRVYMVEDFTN